MKHTYISTALHMLIHSALCCLIFLFIVVNVAEAKIVFASNGICVMNDDGSSKRRLTEEFDRWPCWSPDGKQIAFVRYDENDTQKSEVFIMNANGTNQQQLTHSGGISGMPAWSPDGKHLLFDSNRSGKLEIYVMVLESRTIKQLTGVGKPHHAVAPDWSPDGKEILYEKFISRGIGLSHKNIWVMSADGTNNRPLLPDPVAEDPPIFRAGPEWSPDGQQILYHESTEGFGQRIHRFVIQRRVGVKKRIDIIKEKIGGEWVGSGECWMDDGRAILFSAGLLDDPKKEHHDIYRYEIATQRLRRLTRDPKWDTNPDWVEGALPVSPQGKLPTQWGEMKTVYGVETSNKKLAIMSNL